MIGIYIHSPPNPPTPICLYYLTLLIKLFVMSFFVQSERKTDFETLATPSPGQYQPSSLGNSRRHACAPFGSTQPLNRSAKPEKKDTNPQKFGREYEQVFSVNDMNIKIKPQAQISAVFRSGTERFNNNTIEQPGPGQYELKNSIMEKAKSKSQSQFLHQYTLPIKPTVPSIPVDNLGFKEDEQNEMKKVRPPKADAPHPGSYEVSTALNAKGVITWKLGKPIEKEKELHPGPGDYDYSLKGTKGVKSCFHSSTDRFGKIKKFKEDKIPGPGQYNIQSTKKASHNMSNESYFNSKTARFQKERVDNTGPGMYYNQLNSKNKSHSMNTIRRMPLKEETNRSINRKTIFQADNKNPGPGEYRTNYGISYQLHKALLKKQTTDVLPREKRAVPGFEPKEEEYYNPGPGSYEQDTKRASKGKLWKRTEVVNLKGEEEPSPSPMDYPNFYNTIESKVKQMNSKLTLTEEKPFNSGSERFKHYSNTQNKPHFTKTEDTQEEEAVVDIIKATDNKKVKRLVMTTIKVRVPFGISSNKYEEKTSAYEGPDFYERQVGWVKPSFNIKGKIQ